MRKNSRQIYGEIARWITFLFFGKQKFCSVKWKLDIDGTKAVSTKAERNVIFNSMSLASLFETSETVNSFTKKKSRHSFKV